MLTGRADRPEGAARSTNLVQLPQVIGEILATGPKSKKVGAEVSRLVAALGPELGILGDVPVDDLGQAGGALLAEAITRLRRGEVRREAGYDGEYGVVRLFGPGELDRSATLFEVTRPGPAASASGGDPAAGNGLPAAANGQPAARSAPGRGHAAAGAARPGRPASARRARPGDLDLDQQAAVLADGPLMIIAGPGTGKTRTLAHRIGYQIAERGAAPQSCLAITFTRRAAREMRERLAVLAPHQAADITVTTFHGLGLMILRDHPGPAGLTSSFGIADDDARLEVAAGLAGSQREGRRLLADAAADPERRQRLVRALLARDLVDLDGLVELPAALLRDRPVLAAALRARWPLISVDEYQDIDAAQFELLRLLAGDGSGLTAIGDPDQAIYGFRGANVGFFLQFAAHYPGATTLHLSRNYRATPDIVTGALQAIGPATLVPGRELRAVRPRGAPITFHEAADEQAEAAWIAAAIDGLLGGSSFHSLDSGRADGYGLDGIDLSDVAILYRTDAQAGPLGQALTRAGLPFQKSSHDLLQRRTGVPDIIREMRLSLAGPACPGPAADGRPAPGSRPAPDGTGPAGHAGDGHATGAGTTVSARLRGAVRRLAARGPGRAAAAVDVRSAGQVLAPLARRCGRDMERFLTEISLGAMADALDPRAEAITLLTLHAAKGLEFDVVFLAGCERGLLPLWVPGIAPAEAPDPAEERRLLFVGMTRARARLFLSCAAQRTRRGATATAGPSPFLRAISPALLDHHPVPRPRRPADRQLRLL